MIPGRRWLGLKPTLALAALAALAGCSDDDPSTPLAITLALSPTTVTVTQGATSNVTVNVTRQGDVGPVTITATNLPAGVTAAPLTVAAGSTSGTLALTATAAAAPTTGTATIRASASGASDATQSLAVTVQQASPGSFTLTAPSTNVSVAAGGSTNVNLTIGRTAPFAGAVALTSVNTPTGFTVTFNPASVTGTTATATVAAAANVAPGNYTITLRGTGTGVTDQTLTLATTVTAAAGFTLSLAQPTASVQAGASGTATVNIARTGGFTGAVNLTASGLPAGVTASFNPASATGNSSTLTLNVPANTAAGTSNVTITGAATGLANQTATLALTITAPPAGTGNVVLDFCGELPTAVFYQNGRTGAWTQATGANNRYTFSITADVGGIAWVTDRGAGDVDTEVYLGTRQELESYSSLTLLCNQQSGAGKTVNLQVPGLTVFDQAYFALGNSIAVATGATGGSATFQNVRPGPVDFFGGRNTFSLGSNFELTGDLTRVFMQRNLNPAAGSTLTADLAGPNSAAPASAQVTINGINAEPAILSVGYVTANQSFGVLFADGAGSTAATRTWKGFPSSLQQTGDFHFLQVQAYGPSVENANRIRTAVLMAGPVTNRTVSLGPDLSAVTLSTLRANPLRLQASLPRQSEYATIYDFNSSQGGKDFQVQATGGYVGTSSPVVIAWPDFQGVAGFNAAWLPVAGSVINWTVGATGASNTTNPFSEGNLLLTGIRLGTYTP